MLAQPAAASVAREATGVNLDARLGKREVTRTQTRFGARPEEFTHEIFDRTLEFAEGDVGIDCQPFHLVENVRVSRVGIIAPVNLARNDDAYWSRLPLHRVHLHRRGVRAQQTR